jgi:hypothetical protein
MFRNKLEAVLCYNESPFECKQFKWNKFVLFTSLCSLKYGERRLVHKRPEVSLRIAQRRFAAAHYVGRVGGYYHFLLHSSGRVTNKHLGDDDDKTRLKRHRPLSPRSPRLG